jgi:tRNA A-37 threonylcarbamoyl transferase component Bud32
MTKAKWRGEDAQLWHVSGSDRTKVSGCKRRSKSYRAKYLDQRTVDDSTLAERKRLITFQLYGKRGQRALRIRINQLRH